VTALLPRQVRGWTAGRGWWSGSVRLLAIVLGAIGLGYAVVWNVWLVLLGTGAALVLVTLTRFPDFFPRLFVPALGLLLAGYAFFGRAFAHLGVSPVYVGELVLFLGLLGAVTNRNRWAAFRCPVAWFYLAFALWGAARAVPYIRIYGVDVLRDSVTWAYGAFALLVPAFAVRRGWLATLFDRYAKWFPILVLWIPVGLLLGRLFPHLLPIARESGEQMEFLKPSAAGVNLAGGGVFLLLGLHRIGKKKPLDRLPGGEWLLGGAFIVAFIAVAVLGRGGALAILLPVFLVLLARPVLALPKLVVVGSTAITMVLAFLALNISVELGRRDFSVYQLTSNLMSIVGDTPEDEKNLQQTADWRLRWWTKVIDYTIYGPYFWTGKGFGINLAADDGIKDDPQNRSPHSAHMTVLARMGVPGEVLWLLFQGSFSLSLLAAYLRARRRHRDLWARVNLWLLSYWLASLIAMSFGVYLEGPYGGIWFWSLIGLGMAVLQAQRQYPAPGPAAPSTGVRHAGRARAQLLPAAGR
jgi:hypothetical protein